MTSGRARDRVGAVDHLERRDAHRASRTVHELDVREQLVEPVADDAVGLAAATSMMTHGRVASLAIARASVAGGVAVAVLVEIFHDGCVLDLESRFQLLRGASKTGALRLRRSSTARSRRARGRSRREPRPGRTRGRRGAPRLPKLTLPMSTSLSGRRSD